MVKDFIEKPLVQGVYLRVEPSNASEAKLFYSLRTANNLNTFPINGNTYRGENNDSAPMTDLISLLEARSIPYQRFQEKVGVPFHELIHNSGEYKGERALKAVVSEAKQIFFNDQLPRISLVGKELRRCSKELRLQEFNHPLHYDFSDFSKVYRAVIGLHRAVQAAESTFDLLVVGTTAESKDKYGEEPWVRSPLELAERYLKVLTQVSKGAATALQKARSSYIEEQRQEAQKDGASLAEKLSELLK